MVKKNKYELDKSMTLDELSTGIQNFEKSHKMTTSLMRHLWRNNKIKETPEVLEWVKYSLAKEKLELIEALDKKNKK